MDPPQGEEDEINSTSVFYPTSAILLSPWIWLTLSILVLLGLLFISFRKQRATELCNQAKQILTLKLERLKSKSSSIRLPLIGTTNSSSNSTTSNPTRLSRSISTSSSISSNSSNEDDDDDDDELLPFSTTASSSRNQSYASFQRKSRSMFENLKENFFESGKSVIESLGWSNNNDRGGVGGGGSGGLKRLLMGKRDVDREMGRIRLGGGNLFELGGEGGDDDDNDLKVTVRPSINRSHN
ncbi:hypothetical protein JCM5350_004059 [Sporobolomyces pararoseus]